MDRVPKSVLILTGAGDQHSMAPEPFELPKHH